LYVSESDWRVDADNPISSAYGIPQALTSMHDLPADYYTSAESQIRWGLEYIRDSYGSPCSAWDFKQANNWY
ncbi:MAG: aggregation-promoting factor C-terminal-like domain-containing protein, partial [Nocardioides sp.]